ncbi:MAG: MarR family transcriptional regulator [Chloroflexota bacterium]
MSDERDMVIAHILDIDKRLYQYLQVARSLDWAGLELTMPQLKVLFLAGGAEPMPAGKIARALGMTLSTATGVVDRLVNQGLIQRLENPNDRRIVLLQATPAGAELLERLLSAGLRYFHEILDRLSLDDLRTVARAFDILHETAMAIESNQRSATSNRLARKQRLKSDC